MAESLKQIVFLCFFSPEKYFRINFVWSLRKPFLQTCLTVFTKVKVFHSKSDYLYKYNYIGENQQVSSKLSSGHVKWDFDSHAFIFHKSYFFGSKSEIMNYFYFQKSTVLPQNFLCRLTTQFCQLYWKTFAKSLRFFLQNRKVINMFFFQRLACFKSSLDR